MEQDRISYHFIMDKKTILVSVEWAYLNKPFWTECTQYRVMLLNNNDEVAYRTNA